MQHRALALTIMLLAAGIFAGCTGPTPAPQPGASGTPPSTGKAAQQTFDAASPATLPAGWAPVFGNWTVRANASAPSPGNVLEQSRRDNGVFPIVVAEGLGTYANFEASVKFNVLQGEFAKAGGIAFRLQDDKNFYVIRANANEGGTGDMDFSLFVVKNGERSKHSFGTVTAALGTWHTMGVEARGDKLVFRFDGKQAAEWEDETYKVGKVALWTKDDSVVLFDDFAVEPFA